MQQSTCSRCHAPVGGDFKFCPECAFRLRSGPAEGEEDAPGGGLGWLVLLLFCGLGLLAAGYFVGREIMTGEVIVRHAPAPVRPLTTHGIQDHLVRIGPGIATYRLEILDDTLVEAVRIFWESVAEDGAPDFLQDLLDRPDRLDRWTRFVAEFDEWAVDLADKEWKAVPVRTEEFLMMDHEVTCGQYDEFLRSVKADPRVLTREAFVRDFLWRPSADNPQAVDYSRHYRRHWWVAVAEHHNQRENRSLERPSWLDQTGLSDEQAQLLLVPPAWVRVDEFGSFSWKVEPGTENLPVTEISWWDARMFTVWAQMELSINTLALPNAAQWLRAFHSNHPPRPADDYDEKEDLGYTWPWGQEEDRHGCNNLNHSENATEPRLRDVQRTYNWHKGKTVDGVLNMAGNAAEWVHNWQRIRLEGRTSGPYHARTNEERMVGDDKVLIPKAYTAGGSYLSGLNDCSVELNATLDKCMRAIHVGFRLIMTPGLGG